MADHTVFVLGAGFTRAFIPQAPLLTDPYPLEPFLTKFSQDAFPHAHKILRLEKDRAKASGGRFDLERLMTRLDSSMPHDFDKKMVQEVDLLRHDLYEDFVNKLSSINLERKIPAGLQKFAKWCVERQAHCITFNYDDFLDQALWDVKRVYSGMSGVKYWHPNSGYAFFCPSQDVVVQGTSASMTRSSMLLLKLHGSINWKVKRGAARPFQLDTIVHTARWCEPDYVARSADPVALDRHLEPIRLIVLPVLMKSDLTQEPCFRLLWADAYKKLEEATRVIFIGYSMPRTDIVAACLFGEALQNCKNIQVVNRCKKGTITVKQELIASYRSVLPQSQFHFDGAVPWLKKNKFIE